MIGVLEVAMKNMLSIGEVEESILFLKGERRIKFVNKSLEPINSGVVYQLTDEGYAWFAKTNYQKELLGTIPKSAKSEK